MLVVDSSAAVEAALSEAGFDLLSREDLAAPPLLLSETVSAIHELAWRGEITAELARIALDRMLAAPVRTVRPRGLEREAWRVADDLGWARTYDAEFVALARILRCPLLTLDARLQRGASGIVRVVGPADL